MHRQSEGKAVQLIANAFSEWESRKWLWNGSTLAATRYCSRRAIPGSFVHVRSAYVGDLHLGGLTRCSSVWACPMCARRIQTARKEALSLEVGEWDDVMMVTLTIDQRKGETLRQRRWRLTETWRRAVRSAHWSRLKPKYVRVMELTAGSEGLGHPHFHVIVNGVLPALDLLEAWLKASPRSSRRAQDVRVATGAEAVDYLTREAFGSWTKGTAHWRTLEQAIAGFPGAHARWSSIEQAMKGARQLTVSRGIKIGPPDDEVPELPLERFLLATLGPCAWRRIQGDSLLLGELTDAWRDWDADRATALLTAHKIHLVANESHGLGCACDSVPIEPDGSRKERE